MPTAGIGLPRIYYRKLLSDPFVGNACSFVSGASYNCVLNYALLPGGSVSVGDLVQYYVAAQDTPGNVTTNPLAGAGGFTANPPAAATPPTTPASYFIATPLSGALTVGSGGGYASLTNPGGLFQAINSNVARRQRHGERRERPRGRDRCRGAAAVDRRGGRRLHAHPQALRRPAHDRRRQHDGGNGPRAPPVRTAPTG